MVRMSKKAISALLGAAAMGGVMLGGTCTVDGLSVYVTDPGYSCCGGGYYEFGGWYEVTPFYDIYVYEDPFFFP